MNLGNQFPPLLICFRIPPSMRDYSLQTVLFFAPTQIQGLIWPDLFEGSFLREDNQQTDSSQKSRGYYIKRFLHMFAQICAFLHDTLAGKESAEAHKMAQERAKLHKNTPFCTDACNTPLCYTPVSARPTCFNCIIHVVFCLPEPIGDLLRVKRPLV